MHRIDGEGATSDQRFTEGNPITGAVPTVVTAGWLNDLQENIMRVLKEGGVPATKGRDLDLWDAITAGATKIVQEALQSFEYVQQGGNVTGVIKGGKFTLNAPASPPLPASLSQSGGNVTGTISISGGTFTLTAPVGDGGGGGGNPNPIIANGILVGSPAGEITAIPQSNWDGSARDAKLENGTWVSASFPDIGFYAADRVGAGAVGFCAETAGTPNDTQLFFEGRYHPSLEPAYRVTTAGNAFVDGAFSGGGADYAEWFETADGAPIPVGIAVVLEGGTVRPARSGDARKSIIGVTRPAQAAGMIGNSAELAWQGRFLKDPFGAPLLGPNGDYCRNPAHDPKRPYVPRSKRPEWVVVGLLGQIEVRAGQPLGDRWLKMRALSDAIHLYYVR